MNIIQSNLKKLLVAAVVVLSFAGFSNQAAAKTAADLDNEANQALKQLYKANPAAKSVAKQAKAILVFPHIIRAGLVFGASFGEGVLMENSKVADYYNTVSGSWGLQAGAQSYGYVVFLMNQKAVDYLHKSKGWEFGVGPTVVVVDEGVAKNLSTSTMQDDAYAFIFNQKGLMASLSLEGTKITRINK